MSARGRLLPLATGRKRPEANSEGCKNGFFFNAFIVGSFLPHHPMNDDNARDPSDCQDPHSECDAEKQRMFPQGSSLLLLALLNVQLQLLRNNQAIYQQQV
jgi:hypothetical protein